MQRKTLASLFSLALLAATMLAPTVDAQQPDGGQRGDRQGGRQGGRGGRGFGGGFGGGGGGFGGDMSMFLLRVDAVRTELKVTEDQQELIQVLGDELRASRPEFSGNYFEASDEEKAEFGKKMAAWNTEQVAEAKETLKTILDEGQFKRLQQISLQTQGSGALLTPDVVKELKLSDEQVAALKETQEASREEMGKVMREAGAGGGFDREAMREKMETFRKETEEKMLAHLTDEQKTAYTAMLGEEFDMPEEAFSFGGGRGGRGGRGPGGGRPGGDRPQRPE